MGYVVLTLAAMVSAIGWLVNYISVLALLEWMSTKGCTPPTPEEVKACLEHASRKLFRIK